MSWLMALFGKKEAPQAVGAGHEPKLEDSVAEVAGPPVATAQPKEPAAASGPVFGYCKCGRVIGLRVDGTYSHLDGQVLCRNPKDVQQLGVLPCELDTDNPIEPVPTSVDDARRLAMREPSKSLWEANYLARQGAGDAALADAS